VDWENAGIVRKPKTKAVAIIFHTFFIHCLLSGPVLFSQRVIFSSGFQLQAVPLLYNFPPRVFDPYQEIVIPFLLIMVNNNFVFSNTNHK